MKATEQSRHMYLIQTCGENSPIGVKISWPPLIEPRRPVQYHPLNRILMKFPLIVLLSISDGTRSYAASRILGFSLLASFSRHFSIHRVTLQLPTISSKSWNARNQILLFSTLTHTLTDFTDRSNNSEIKQNTKLGFQII